MPKKTDNKTVIDFENLTGKLTLDGSHSLVIPHKPKNLKPLDVASKIEEESNCEVLSFGLFESSTPNYATYYPGVTNEDLNPKDEEFIQPIFRMLSETIVSKYAPIDFSKKGVLKKSMRLLLGQTVNIDHETALGNAIGSVAEVFWQNSYTSKDGIKVPAGINAVLKIDGKSNPRIARGIMMNPPSIHSNSVTVRFKWEPSHTYENMNEFYNKIGTYEKDGELVRLLVTDISSYHETSLVAHGADVFAQKVDSNGEIVNPGYASSVYNFSAEKLNDLREFIEYKSGELSLSKEVTILDNINNKDKNNNLKNMEILKKLQEKLGLENLTEENVVDEIANLISGKDSIIQEKEDSLTAIQTKLTDSENEVVSLNTKVTGLETKLSDKDNEMASFTTVLEETRNEATRLYKTLKAEKAEDAILKLISESNVETAASFVRQYREELESFMPITCNDCKSTNVSRQSTKTTKNGLKGDEGNTDEGNNEVKADVEVYKAFKNRERKSITLSSNN